MAYNIKDSVVHFHAGAEDNRKVKYEQNILNTFYESTNKDSGIAAKEKHDANADFQDEEEISCSKQPKVTHLEKILSLQDESSACCDEGKDDEAYGILTKLYQLGASVAFAPTLIDYYVVLLKTNQFNESEIVFNRLVDLMKNKIKPTLKECTLLGEKYRTNKDYFKSILFHLIGGELLEDIKDADRVLIGVQSCALGIKLCMMKMTDDSPTYNEILKRHVIPVMRKTILHIPNVRGKSRKALCLVEAVCKHHVEICEGLVGDYNASETTLKETITLLEDTLGEEVRKVHLYGTTLNNLGATLLRQRKPQEAKDMLFRAIDANMTAEDYTAEEERKKDVQRSESAITQAEDMLKN